MRDKLKGNVMDQIIEYLKASNFNIFDISFNKLNLFSFMLGMTWAFFHQGLFGKMIGKYIFLYFACLAAWYAFLYLNTKS